MKLIRLHLLTLLLCILTQTAFSQDRKFHFKREIIDIPSEGWYSVKLPNDIFSDLNQKFSDVRIFRISEKDSVEIPYILHVDNDVITNENIDLTIINKSKKENALYFTLELQGGQKVNSLDLAFKQKNYNGLVKIEGSNDQKEWFEIVDRQRILSLQNEFVDYSMSTLNFPTSNYTYLRITTTADVPLDLVQVSVKNQIVKKGVVNNIPLTWNVVEDYKTKQTIVHMTLDYNVPVSKLKIDISHDDDYYRDFSMDYVTDSSKTPKGWVKFYSTISENYVTSLNTNSFDFSQVVGKEFRLVIRNNDNRPLTLKAVELMGPQVVLKTKLKPGRTFLFYGNPSLESPTYDLSRFEKNIPESMPMLSIGIKETMVAQMDRPTALFDSKLWLWGIMAILMAVLGFFTFRMMKRTN